MQINDKFIVQEYNQIKNTNGVETLKKLYCVIDPKTNQIIDNNNGQGYLSDYQAYTQYFNKISRNLSNQEKQYRKNKILRWLDENPQIVKDFEDVINEVNGEYQGYNIQLNAPFITKLLKKYDLHPDFPAIELLLIYKANYIRKDN